jgi:hypothetical protein
MRYAVEWVPQAEDDLTTIWLAATDRDAVALAVHRLENALAFDPLRLGEGRESSVHRFTTYQMLSIMFEVIEDDKKVLVHGVFAIG